MGLNYDKVNFQRCTDAEYKALINKDKNTVYFILDKQKIYLGNKLFSSTESGGSSELPEVTDEDNGDVLTVVDGVWDKAKNTGILICSVDEQTGEINKTWQEIYDAEFCVIITEYDDGKDYLNISSIYFEDSKYYVLAYAGDILITFEASSADDYPISNNQ